MGSPPQPPLPLHPSILSDQQDRDKPGQWGLLYVDDIKFPVSIDDIEFPVSRKYIDVVNNDHQSASFHRRPVAVPSPSRRHSVDLSQPFCRPLPAVLSTSPPLTILSSAGRKTIASRQVQKWPRMLPARNFSPAEVTETHENASDEGL